MCSYRMLTISQNRSSKMNRNRIVVIGITAQTAVSGYTMWDASIDARGATILCPVQISIRLLKGRNESPESGSILAQDCTRR